jgi:hypothetical protein
MAFYDLLKSKYLNDVATDKIEPNSLQKVIETNLWPADYIELEGEMKHIYLPEVKITDIFDFFKARMPWIKLQLNNQDILEKNPGDMMAVKFVCFHQLAGLLSEVYTNFNRAFQRTSLLDAEGATHGPSIH